MSEDVSDSVLAMLGDSGDPVPESTDTESGTESVEATETEATTEVETKEPEAQAEETKAEESKEEAAEEPEAEKKGIDPQHAAMLAKANDEKQKRQALQTKYEEAQAKLAELEKSPPIDPVVDPEGFQGQIQQQLDQMRQDFDSKLTASKFETSRQTLMAVKDDYAEMETIFAEAAEDNPVLRSELAQAENPALYAYQMGQKIQALSADPETVRAQMKAEILAELKAESEAETAEAEKASAKIDDAISPSLANTGNSGIETEAPVGMDFIAESTGVDANKRRSR